MIDVWTFDATISVSELSDSGMEMARKISPGSYVWLSLPGVNVTATVTGFDAGEFRRGRNVKCSISFLSPDGVIADVAKGDVLDVLVAGVKVATAVASDYPVLVTSALRPSLE